MTNKSKKRHHDKYRDPFELHRLQCESNIKKMRMEKRLNVFNGNAINSGTTPATLQLSKTYRKRLVLSDKTNTNGLNQNAKYINEKLMDKPKVTISGMRDSIIAMHRKSNTQKLSFQKTSVNKPNKISIFALSSIIKSTKFTTHMKNGCTNRLLEISRDIIIYTPFESINKSKDSILSQARLYIKSFIEWFKINKFDYILVAKNLEGLKTNSETENLHANIPREKTSALTNQDVGMVGKISKQRYIRHDQRQNAANPNPTHIVQKYKKVGKFMATASVKDIYTKKTCVVLLLRTDIRFKVNTNDMLVLMDKSRTTQIINNKEIPVYMNWQIYKEKPIDIDFFS